MAFGRFDAAVPCFDMQLFSCFEHEKEVLFFGGDSILKICSIIKYERGSWRSFARKIRALEAIRSLVIRSPLPNEVNVNTKHAMLFMSQSVLEEESVNPTMSPYIRRSHHYQLDSAPNHIELDWSILVEDNKIFSSILMKTMGGLQLLNFENLSNLFPMSRHLTIAMPSGFTATDDFINSVCHDVNQVAQRRSATIELLWDDSCQQVVNINLMKLKIVPNVSMSKHFQSITFKGTFQPINAKQVAVEKVVPLKTERSKMSNNIWLDLKLKKQMRTVSGFVYDVLGPRESKMAIEVRRIIFDYCAFAVDVRPVDILSVKVKTSDLPLMRQRFKEQARDLVLKDAQALEDILRLYVYLYMLTQ